MIGELNGTRRRTKFGSHILLFSVGNGARSRVLKLRPPLLRWTWREHTEEESEESGHYLPSIAAVIQRVSSGDARCCNAARRTSPASPLPCATATRRSQRRD